MKTRIPPPIITLLAAILMWVLHRWMPLAQLIVSPWSRWGWLFAGAGIGIALAAFNRFQQARTTVNPREPHTASSLVTGGVFQISRNPMYLGLLLILIGWALGLGTASPWIVPPVFILAITVLQIIPEEQVLESYSVSRTLSIGDTSTVGSAAAPRRTRTPRFRGNRMHESHCRIILVMLLGVFCQRVLADAPESIAPLTYVHVYADGAGASHFREEHFDFTRGRDAASSIHALEAKGGATLLRLKAGAFEDWHNAPRAWYLIVLQGTSEVTTSDGQVRQFGPGSVVLLDDTTGKGHQTRALGKIDHIAAVIPIVDAPVTGAK